jgi:micrococcal nuclease
VNLEMVRAGMAWRYDKYSKDAELLAAQEAAKEGRLGLWRDREPVAPWDWRAMVKAK